MKESVKEGWRVSLKMTCQPSVLITMDLRSMAKASNWKTHFSHSVTKQYARSAAGCKKWFPSGAPQFEDPTSFLKKSETFKRVIHLKAFIAHGYCVGTNTPICFSHQSLHQGKFNMPTFGHVGQ